MKISMKNVFDERKSDALSAFIAAVKDNTEMISKTPANTNEAYEYAQVISVIVQNWLYTLKDAVDIADMENEFGLSQSKSILTEMIHEIERFRWSLNEI